MIRLALSYFIAASFAATSFASSGRTAFTPECAHRDLHAVGWIERRGEADDVPSDQLAEAGLLLLQARLSCLSGNEMAALAIYRMISNAERQSRE
jgi:hypothetical protein